MPTKRFRLLVGASAMALALAMPASALAQSAVARAAAGFAGVTMPAVALPHPTIGAAALTGAQGAAISRALQSQARVAAAVSLAQQAQAAARASIGAISAVPNGLVAGGLVPVANPAVSSLDPTGLNTWQGAAQPTQQAGTKGGVTVTVKQTESRAILSWQSFNVGKDTALVFDQKANGVAQKDWVALNRVVGVLDPATGRRDPNATPNPSRILGSIKADGTVLIINQAGVMFGANAQVNTHSLVATSLEIGHATALNGATRSALTIRQRDDAFLNFGLLGFSDQASASERLTAFTFSAQAVDADNDDPLREGDVIVSAGADIAADAGGLLLLTAPTVVNSGHLEAVDGQVSLASGRRVTLTRSEGTPNSADPFVRGLLVDAQNRDGDPTDYVWNTEDAIIESRRGYLSIGATANGALLEDGVASATTSVSRNGFVSLTGGSIALGPRGTIAITADTDAATIPQAASSVADFKTSRVRIGDALSSIDMAGGATIYAPGGDVAIGAAPGRATLVDDPADAVAPRVFIDSGALIDVAGLADVAVPASRNAIAIDPVKGNELRDTPGYRDSFLNGATVHVDPRLSGVRDDGVAWVGSPLIEAASYYDQVGVTASELLTKGGNVSIGVPSFSGGGDPATAPDVIVKADAVIDFSGGWVRYDAGNITTSRLVTVGGGIVDIGAADPDGSYVGLVGGFAQALPNIGATQTFSSPVLSGTRYEASYTEGRDAGSLTIKASAIALDGSLHGDAYAGATQRADAHVGTARSSVYGDLRNLQAAPSQLPAAGYLAIQALGISSVNGLPTGGGDIRVTSAGAIPLLAGGLGFGETPSIDQTGALVKPLRDPASLLPAERRDIIMLSGETLADAGLGQISLGTSGAVTIDTGTSLAVAPGGVVTVDAGRGIDVAGAIVAPAGTIGLTTYEIADGSAFADDAARAGSFDIAVTGTISAAGRWVNDYQATATTLIGGAYTSGGAIAMTVAPRVSVADGSGGATDVSGSILIARGALLDVSGGGHVDAVGNIDTSARGGDLSLVDETSYFQISATPTTGLEAPGNVPGFRVTGSPAAQDAINPAAITGRVGIDGTILAHGFAGGGSFTLEAPAIGLGGAPAAANATVLPLDFFSRTGFADYAIRSYGTALLANRFDNDLGGYNAVLATQTLTVGAGQTLDLAQSRFSPLLDDATALALRGLATDASLYTLLAPAIPVDAYDRQGIGLTLGGLTELHVTAGGAITGDAGASLTVAKLWNEGDIRLVGGTITQSEVLPDLYVNALAVRGLDEAFTTDADGTIHETVANAAGVRGSGNAPLTNGQLALRPIYLLGALDADEGVRLASGSTIDLSGASLRDPRIVQPVGVTAPVIGGRLVAGGTLQTLAVYSDVADVFARPTFGQGVFNNANVAVAGSRAAGRLDAQVGAGIDIAGAADVYSQQATNGSYAAVPVWSAGGRLSLGAGGTLAGATIDAAGGAAQAAGGTLEWLDPVLVAVDPGVPALDTISAQAIAAAGFDNFTALGSLRAKGDVRLDLRNAFTLASRPYDGVPETFDRFEPTVSSTGALDVHAARVLFDGVLQSIASPARGVAGTGAASFTAGTIAISGSVLFDRSIAALALDSAGDLQLTGARPYQQTLGLDATQVANSLGGQLLASGDVAITAAQLYPTTGSRFLIASAGADSTISIARTAGTSAATPYSAGGDLLVQAAHIIQGGTVRVPIGTLAIGATTASAYAPATRSVELASGSITSVSANGLSIPYGTTTDQTEYFFTPTNASALTAPPAAVLDIAGDQVSLDDGATVDIKGGGDLYAYEFVPGTGGSRDVLDRFASDPFSSDGGFQYPDGRQVYAIVPGLSDAQAAAFDPIYSSDYAGLYGADAGSSVTLAAAPGLAAGRYTLLPAQYAMLPGGMRVVEEVGATAIAGGTGTLRDGTIATTGRYGIAGTDIEDSRLRSFSVQTQPVFEQYSDIVLTSATKTFGDRAARGGVPAPRLPTDAARLVLEPGRALKLDASLATAPASGGRGARVDIAGDAFAIVNAAGDPTPDGAIALTAGGLTGLGADSLLIGGVRGDNADGTTSLDVTAGSILVANDAAHPLSAPELLLAVDGSGSSLAVADGAVVTASGTLSDTATGDYLLAGASGGRSGTGAMLRVADGAERLLARSTPQPVAAAPALSVGAATIGGTAVLLDSAGDATIAPSAVLNATELALGASAVAFGSDPSLPGLVISPALQSRFADASRLTLRSAAAIAFAGGRYGFGDIVLDTPGLSGVAGTAGTPPTVVIDARAVKLDNSGAAAGPGTTHGAGTLSLTATTLDFTGGTLRATGFDGGSTLAAAGGITYRGSGGYDAGAGPLAIVSPFVADAAVPVTPGSTSVLPALTLASTGAVTMTSPAGATATAAPGTPGATLAIDGGSISVTDTDLRATAGRLTLTTPGDIAIAGSAMLATPGYSRSFGDASDGYTVAAPGGTLSLVSGGGGIALGADTTLSVGGGAGAAGMLKLLAAAGTITFGGTLDGAAPVGGGSLDVDTGGSFDLGGFAAAPSGFTGAIAVRSGQGDLALAAQGTLRATSIALTADGGRVDLAGTIDTSGEQGGDVTLYGEAGVHLAGGARIDAHADGRPSSDARPASGGDVTLGTENGGAIAIDGGALIDIAARRAGNRLVPITLNGTTYYSFVQADSGGTLTLRAPIIEQVGPDSASVRFAGSVTGASAITLEAFKRYDLAALAGDERFTGVSVAGGTAILDTGASASGRLNVLADGGDGTIPGFVHDFDVSGAYAGLGTLTRDPAFSARPGIELDYTGNIRLASNWNLGAGTVDVAAAVAAGDMVASTALPGRYIVVAGREADLLERFTDMTYRVGGAIGGAAGALAIRAGGDLDIGGVVTDGFFNFRDQTDPTYLTNVVGGDNSTYLPTVRVTCLAASTSCANVPDYAFNRVSFARITVDLSSFARLRVGGGLVAPTPLPDDIPFSATANSAAAAGGDASGGAAMFPLLGDGGYASSWSYRLVAGAAASADPLRVDPGASGDVSVTGSRSYSYGGSSSGYAPGLLLNIFSQTAPLSDLLAGIRATFARTRDTAYTSITLPTGNSALAVFLRQRALAFVAANAGHANTSGATATPTALVTTVALADSFLAAIQTDLAAIVENPATGALPPLTGSGQTTASVRNYVRTGTGRIDMAAAGNVDLRSGAAIRYTSSTGADSNAANGYQVGGSAIYTAGHVAAPGLARAVDPLTGETRTLDASNDLLGDTPSSEAARFSYGTALQTALRGLLVADPVYAEGGGDVAIAADGDVLGQRDASLEQRLAGASGFSFIGAADQPWRVGTIGTTTNLRVNPDLFTSGVGALGGGSVSVVAGGDISDLTVTALTSATTANVAATATSAATQALWTLGGGDVSLLAGGDLLGGRIDVGRGSARLVAAGDIAPAAALINAPSGSTTDNALRLRIGDADASVAATGSLRIAGIAALGATAAGNPTATLDGRGSYGAGAALDLLANGNMSIDNRGGDVVVDAGRTGIPRTAVYPGTLQAVSMQGDLAITSDPADSASAQVIDMVPSTIGQLRLLAAGDIAPVTIAMDDRDPGQLPGIFSAFAAEASGPLSAGQDFGFPATLPDSTSAERTALHNAAITHLGDAEPVRIAAGGDIAGMILSVSKQARIAAGQDILDMMFFGQNIASGDVTRITAGRDITATTRLVRAVLPDGTTGDPLSAVQGNNFVIGGPGAFMLEAGRDAGPFLTSATADPLRPSTDGTLGAQGEVSYGGGIQSLGNEDNPALPATGADILVQFGVAKGADYAALRETYVDPAHGDGLPDYLFAQTTDANGNQVADRTKPIYGPILIAWMQGHAPDALLAAYGTTTVDYAQAYAVFAALPELRQRVFLVNQVYFNELRQTSVPSSASYLRYSRGYLAVNALFPAALGYTANSLDGGAAGASQTVATGDLDLRLATIQTSRGGDVSILGPGGRVLAGSTVSTADQAARRSYDGARLYAGDRPTVLLSNGNPATGFSQTSPSRIDAIPTGFEGILTLRGGAINSFTDGDLLLNQSRLFSEAGGDVTLWSSNGDLNAGQGPKTSANFPPVVVRIDENGNSEVDAVGGVTGAGIAAFQPAAGVTPPNVYLIAPRGTVDAGDAGVRVAGNLFIAAAAVANSDNFQVGGTSFGIPAATIVDASTAAAANAASNAAQQLAQQAAGGGRTSDSLSQITVNVLGFTGDSDPCDHNGPKAADCPPGT